MGYRKRGDKYEVNVAHKGARKFATVDTEAEAKTKVVELKAELIREHREKTGQAPLAAPTPEPVTGAPSWTLKKALDKTFEVRWTGTKSEEFYRTKAKVLLAHFGEEKLLADIKMGAIDDFKAALRKKGNGQQTINHALVTLSMAFKIAMEREGVTFRPKMGVKRSKKSRVRWLSEEEEATILGYLTQWGKKDFHDWTCVLVDTGMRPSETKKMDDRWCDFRTGAIHVLESKTEAGKRVIPMTARVRIILERRCLDRASQGKHILLFPYAWARYQDTWGTVREVMKLSEEPDFVPYCLRHTFATRLVQRGVPIEVISKLLGHEDVTQTMIYAKIGAHQYVNAIAKLEKTHHEDPKPTPVLVGPVSSDGSMHE